MAGVALFIFQWQQQNQLIEIRSREWAAGRYSFSSAHACFRGIFWVSVILSCPEILTGVVVQTLDDAQALAACFDPAHVQEMAVLYRRRRDPVQVLDAATAVPSAFLNYLASTDHVFQELLTYACLHPENAPLSGIGRRDFPW